MRSPTGIATFGNNRQMIAGYETQAAQVLFPEMHIQGTSIRFAVSVVASERSGEHVRRQPVRFRRGETLAQSLA